MLNKKIISDIHEYAEGKESLEIVSLKQQLQKYTGKVEIKDPQEMVNVILLVSMLMDVEEDIFDETVNRLHHVLVKKATGLDPKQIMEILKGNKSKGPLQ